MQERTTDIAKLVSGQLQVTRLKGIKKMNFGEFEAQPEFLLPKFRAGVNSFKDLLVPFDSEDIVTVDEWGLGSTLGVLANNNYADGVLVASHRATMWGVCLQPGTQSPEGVGFSNCVACELQYHQEQLELRKLILPAKAFETYSSGRE